MKKKLTACIQLMRLNKPVGILLLLWPTLWALWLAAGGMPPIKVLLVFVAGVVVMRSAGCVINDIADRDVDGHVERTKARPLATRAISLTWAMSLFLSLLFIGLSLVLQLNALAFKLAFPALLLAIVYPFCKRFFVAPQLVLGMAFAWAVPMAFAAVLGRVPAQSWLVFAIAMLWPVAYDTMYAMVDRQDDLRLGVCSTAVLLGERVNTYIVLIYLLIILLWAFVGVVYQLSLWFYLSSLFGLSLVIYQMVLIKKGMGKHYFSAFLTNQWLGLLLFLAIFLGQLHG